MKLNHFIKNISNYEFFDFIDRYDWVIGVKNKISKPEIFASTNKNSKINHTENEIVFPVTATYNKTNFDADLLFNDYKVTLNIPNLQNEEVTEFVDRLILTNMFYRKFMMDRFKNFPEYQKNLMNFMINEREGIFNDLQKLEPSNQIWERIYANETYLFGAPIEVANAITQTSNENEHYVKEKFFHNKSNEQKYGTYYQLKFRLPDEHDKPSFE